MTGEKNTLKNQGNEDKGNEIKEEVKEEEEQEVLQTEGIINEKEASFEAELAALRKEAEKNASLAQDYLNQLYRVKADFENFRKRTKQEKQNLIEYSCEQLLTALLPVLDNLERALADKSEDFKSFKAGVAMIYNQFKEILENEGLKVIPAKNQQFDPKLHEAVMTEETTELPDNTVMEELRVGYSYKDKVIRPSMVKVARR